jgi:hypothetical protein
MPDVVDDPGKLSPRTKRMYDEAEQAREDDTGNFGTQERTSSLADESGEEEDDVEGAGREGKASESSEEGPDPGTTKLRDDWTNVSDEEVVSRAEPKYYSRRQRQNGTGRHRRHRGGGIRLKPRDENVFTMDIDKFEEGVEVKCPVNGCTAILHEGVVNDIAKDAAEAIRYMLSHHAVLRMPLRLHID